MSNVIICVGISGSGKSSWTTQFLKENTNYVRCNRDDIRRVLIGDLVDYYGRRDLGGFEKLVTSIEYFIWESAIKRNKCIVIDNTNLKISVIKNILKQFDTANYTVQFKLFDCDLIRAKNRVWERDYLKTPEDFLGQDYNDNLDEPQIRYINKQYQQYQSIKKWILEIYPDNIIT